MHTQEAPVISNGHNVDFKRKYIRRDKTAKSLRIAEDSHFDDDDEESEKIVSPVQAPKQKTKLFPDKQVDMMLQVFEEQVRLAMVAFTEKEPNFKEYETLFLEAKAEMDNIQKTIDEGKEMIANLKRYRENLVSEAEVRILTTTSHTNKPPKRTYGAMPYRYTQMAVAVLKEIDLFITADKIWDAIIQKNPEMPQVLGEKYANAKWNAISNFEKAALANYKKKEKPFVLFNGKLGLPEWCNKDGQPEGKYLAGIIKTN